MLTKPGINRTLHSSSFLPVSRLLVIGAYGCLVVVADAHLVSWAAHLQTGVLGGVWTYEERSGINFNSELWQKNKLVETCRAGESAQCSAEVES